MKRILSVILLLLMSVYISTAALPHLTPEIKVTMISQDPDPVEPGQVTKVKFKVENEGKETTEDVIVQILPQYPFSVYSSSNEKNIGKLRAGSTGADAVIVEFEIKVNENATERKTDIDLQVKIGKESTVSYTNSEFQINIQTHDAVLEIGSISSEPKQIAPGGTGKVTIMIKNLADSLLKDIKFQTSLSGTTIPLAPYQSSSERIIPILESNYQKALTFSFIADPTAVPGLYKIPLNITYNDEMGNSYAVNDVLAVIIGEEPKINAYIKKSTVLENKKEGKLTLEIANAGMNNVKFVELFILPSNDYELISTSTYYYIGDIDSDDTASEEISVYINKEVKTLKMPIKLKFYDANNQNYQQQFDLSVEIYSKSQLKDYGLIQNGNSYLYILIIIIVLGGYFYYRYHKKKKR